MTRPVVIAHHVRTATTALNVVTGALDVVPRTSGLEVRFARSVSETASAVRTANERGSRALVLWSCYSTDWPETKADFDTFQELVVDANALHVIGGMHATAEAEAVLRAGFDFAAIGEGESTIIELVSAIECGTDPRNVRGLAWLADGQYATSGSCERRPLDDFPSFNVRHGRWNAIEITRGCVYACSFCQTPFAFKARFRHRSVASVREHVRAMRVSNAGVNYVRFLSPTSLSYGSDGTEMQLAHVEELLAAVREETGRDAKIYFGTFPSEVRPEHVTRAALAIIARYADNRSLVIGGQSGSDRVLAAMHRGHDVAAIERAVDVAIETGFRPDVDFLLGLPRETQAERHASVVLAERLASRGARIHAHGFMPLPGTPLGDAQPEPIEDDVLEALKALEGRGALYGQWRRQVEVGRSLAQRRER